MNIRLAHIEEYDQIKSIYESVKADLKIRKVKMWTSTYPLDTIENDIINNEMYLLENDNNEILGCFVLLNDEQQYCNIKWQLEGKTLYIERVVINPQNQGQGLSNRIMDFIMSFTKDGGYEIIRLTVLAANDRALSLYKKYDFIEVDKGTHMTKSGRVALAMERKV